MALINLDNSTSIFGTAISIRIESKMYGTHHYIEPTTDTHAIFHHVLDLAPSGGKAVHIRELGHLVNSIIGNSRELYSLQKLLNWSEWRELQISASVEFRREDDPWTKVLLVRTTWQDDPDRNFS